MNSTVRSKSELMRVTLSDNNSKAKETPRRIIISDEYYRKTFLSPKQEIERKKKRDEIK